jgi:adenylosuccinate synthase
MRASPIDGTLHSCRINGFTHLNLTKLDVLSKLETIRLGTGYTHNGQVIPVVATQRSAAPHGHAILSCTSWLASRMAWSPALVEKHAAAS